MLEISQSLKNLFCVKKLKVYSVSLVNGGKTARKNQSKCDWLMHKWCRCPITSTLFKWIPVIEHPHNCVPITQQIGAPRTNQNHEFYYQPFGYKPF